MSKKTLLSVDDITKGAVAVIIKMSLPKDDEETFSVVKTAKLLGVSIPYLASLRRWKNTGPAFVKTAEGRILYSKKSVREFIKENDIGLINKKVRVRKSA